MVRIFALCSLLLVLHFPVIHGWGIEGHTTVCRIAQVPKSYHFILSFLLGVTTASLRLYIFVGVTSLGWAMQQQMQCSNCYPSMQKMTWGVSAFGPIVSSFSITGHLPFTTLTLLTIFALISTIVSPFFRNLNEHIHISNLLTSNMNLFRGLQRRKWRQGALCCRGHKQLHHSASHLQLRFFQVGLYVLLLYDLMIINLYLLLL